MLTSLEFGGVPELGKELGPNSKNLHKITSRRLELGPNRLLTTKIRNLSLDSVVCILTPKLNFSPLKEALQTACKADM